MPWTEWRAVAEQEIYRMEEMDRSPLLFEELCHCCHCIRVTLSVMLMVCWWLLVVTVHEAIYLWTWLTLTNRSPLVRCAAPFLMFHDKWDHSYIPKNTDDDGSSARLVKCMLPDPSLQADISPSELLLGRLQAPTELKDVCPSNGIIRAEQRAIRLGRATPTDASRGKIDSRE